jgi:hypothetical protein
MEFIRQYAEGSRYQDPRDDFDDFTYFSRPLTKATVKLQYDTGGFPTNDKTNFWQINLGARVSRYALSGATSLPGPDTASLPQSANVPSGFAKYNVAAFMTSGEVPGRSPPHCSAREGVA